MDNKKQNKKQNINHYLEIIKYKYDVNFLKSLTKYCIRGSKDSYTYVFLKDNDIIKFYSNTMDEERRYWCHRFMIRKGYELSCSCGKSIKEIIKNEIHYFKKLEKYKYFPKMLKYDLENQYIIMEYAGNNFNKLSKKNIINIPKNYKEQIKEISDIMEKENMYHNDLNLSNMCLKNNIIKIIDFGCIQRLNLLKKNSKFNELETNFNRLNKIMEDFIELNNDNINYIENF